MRVISDKKGSVLSRLQTGKINLEIMRYEFFVLLDEFEIHKLIKVYAICNVNKWIIFCMLVAVYL